MSRGIEKKRRESPKGKFRAFDPVHVPGYDTEVWRVIDKTELPGKTFGYYLSRESDLKGPLVSKLAALLFPRLQVPESALIPIVDAKAKTVKERRAN